MAEEFVGRALDWDDEIEKDSSFVLLPEGDYNFKVLNFERGSFPGSAKLPACKKATLTLKVWDNDGNEAELKADFILHTTLEWKISEIHRAVGLKRHGEKLRMKWREMIGLTGCCKVIQTEGKKAGAKFNNVDKFYDPGDLGVTIATAKPAQGNMFAPRK